MLPDLLDPEEALHRCFIEKMFRKYPANFQENTNAEVQFQKIAGRFH